MAFWNRAAPKTRRVIVYANGHDGSEAVAKALRHTPGVDLTTIHTLDRRRVHIEMGRDREDGQAHSAPSHIVASDRLLREELLQGAPLHFITMAYDPFARHAALAASIMAAHKIPAQAADHLQDLRDFFDLLPVHNSTEWFASEYFTGTAIDVLNAPFNRQEGYTQLTLGVHKLLIVSAELPAFTQRKIISRFLDVDVARFNKPDAPEARRIAARVYSEDETHAVFWDNATVRHFFTPSQVALFASSAEGPAVPDAGAENDAPLLALATKLLTSHDIVKTVERIGRLRGADAARLLALRIAGHAGTRPALTLALMRMASIKDNSLAIALGETQIARAFDARVARALSVYWQRASAIARPEALLAQLPELDARQRREFEMLGAQAKYLQRPFPFSARATATYAPAENVVVYNAHQSLPFHTSGYATRTQGIVRGLARDGWDMRVFTRAGYPHDTGVDAGGLRHAEIDQVPYRYDAPRGVGQWDLPMDQYVDRAAAYLVEATVDLKPRVIHTASNFLCGLAGIEAARRMGVPSIYEMRGLWHVTRWSREPSYAATEKFALAEKMEIEAAQACDHVLAITGALKEWLVEHGVDAGKITLAPNAVDLNQFAPLAPDAAFAEQVECAGKIVIGYIGSFVPYEGLDLLVEAVALLPAVLRGQIRLLWMGDGASLPGLLTQAEALGVRECIVSLGRRPFDEVPRAYSIVDICVFPRRGHPVCEIIAPLKPFEAMAMEKAVLVSDVRPLRELVEDGETGLVFAKDNAADLSEKLARLVADPALRRHCGVQARAWIERTRQWDIIARDISDMYRRI